MRITEYPLLTARSHPFCLALGSDGRVWVGESSAGKLAAIASDGTVTEYPVLTPDGFPRATAAGYDGQTVWYVLMNAGKIGRMSYQGQDIIEWSLPDSTGRPHAIVAGADQAMWFTENYASKIGRITNDGSLTEYSLPQANSGPEQITLGPDGNIWFTEETSNRVGRITPAGVIREYGGFLPGSEPDVIRVGPDGLMYVSEQGGDRVAQLNLSGTILQEWGLPVGAQPGGLSRGPAGDDNAIYVNELLLGQIARISLSDGSITQYSLPTANSSPHGIVRGLDGALWFSKYNAAQMGKLEVVP